MELSEEIKLDSDNYDIWHRKTQYFLNDKKILEILDHVMVEPEHDDLLEEIEKCQPVFEMWEPLKLKFRFTFLTKLRGLTLKFDSYQKRGYH